MTWYQKIIAAHTAVTNNVTHGYIGEGERYFVWMEERDEDLTANNRHIERAMRGTTDLFSRIEFDPWLRQIEQAFDTYEIGWNLSSVQFEDETGYWHYELEWVVYDGANEV